jgi:hypothetical protein
LLREPSSPDPVQVTKKIKISVIKKKSPKQVFQLVLGFLVSVNADQQSSRTA